MAKNLIESKLLDFMGLERNSNQPNRKQNLLRVTNMDTHHKPGTLTIRPGYELRYTAPVDDSDYARLENTEYVSFDNFFERTAGLGTEITIQVEKSEIVAPTVDGNKLNTYKFRAANIWMRPYWKGSYWVDAWQWLNEAYITNITVAADATYKNKIEFEHYFGNLTQWTMINITKDKTLPLSILKTKENGTNTLCWVDTWNPSNIDAAWEVDDIVVIMRNYIPIATQIANYDVNRKEISFHRILSKMRIGFGGKENRAGYAVQFMKNTINLKDYDTSLTAVDPLLTDTETIYAPALKTYLGIYSEFVDDDLTYGINIKTGTGSDLFAVGEYFFRMTVMLDGTDEIMVKETSITIDASAKFQATPIIRAGSFNRRITLAKLYFSENGDDYYLYQSFDISRQNTLDIQEKNIALTDDGNFWLEAIPAGGGTEMHGEPNAASASDIDSVGSWEILSYHNTLTSIAATNWALQAEANIDNFVGIGMKFPINLLDVPLPINSKITIVINHQATTEGMVLVKFRFTAPDGINYYDNTQAGIPVTTAYATQTWVDVYTPKWLVDNNLPEGWTLTHIVLQYRVGGALLAAGDQYQVQSLSIKEQETAYLTTAFELGTSMLVELGYQASFNLIRDWMDSVVLNGITWLAGSYIKGDGRYDNKIFGSQISGLSANMHDVIPPQTFLDVDRYKGEVIVGLAVLSNDSIVALKDGAIIILDPNTGQKYESAVGYGCVNKNSILVIRGTMYWASQEDLMKMSASTGYIADAISDRYVRDIYQSFADKTLSHCCLDKYGAYRIALTDDKEGVEFPELILTERGWLDQNRYHHPQVYRNGLAGRVWFMNNGNIYAFPFEEAAFIGYADVYGNYDSGW